MFGPSLFDSEVDDLFHDPFYHPHFYNRRWPMSYNRGGNYHPMDKQLDAHSHLQHQHPLHSKRELSGGEREIRPTMMSRGTGGLEDHHLSHRRGGGHHFVKEHATPMMLRDAKDSSALLSHDEQPVGISSITGGNHLHRGNLGGRQLHSSGGLESGHPTRHITTRPMRTLRGSGIGGGGKSLMSRRLQRESSDHGVAGRGVNDRNRELMLRDIRQRGGETGHHIHLHHPQQQQQQLLHHGGASGGVTHLGAHRPGDMVDVGYWNWGRYLKEPVNLTLNELEDRFLMLITPSAHSHLGIKPEEMKISLKNNVLTVSGTGRKETKREEVGGGHSRSIHQATFSRSTHIPLNVDQNLITAHHDAEGRLAITFPKRKGDYKAMKEIPITKMLQ